MGNTTFSCSGNLYLFVDVNNILITNKSIKKNERRCRCFSNYVVYININSLINKSEINLT